MPLMSLSRVGVSVQNAPFVNWGFQCAEIIKWNSGIAIIGFRRKAKYGSQQQTEPALSSI